MKFLHTADWHIGKKLHGFDLLAEQREAFKQILAIAKEEQVDAVVILEICMIALFQQLKQSRFLMK
ncbi:hypothetical protein EfsSVR2281_34630 [Enterococcus faecalis]|nr:hypothetical protein EfsSVR2281_34630 [Enterococcus faecalis]